MRTGDALLLGAFIAVSLLFTVAFIAAGHPAGGWGAALGISIWAAFRLGDKR